MRTSGMEIALVAAVLLVALAATVPIADGAAPAILWQKPLGGIGADRATDAQPTSDGGYIVVGSTTSRGGDLSGNHGGAGDVYVARLTADGVIAWERCLGGSGADAAYAVQQTADGGYILAGTTTSSDGDVSGFHPGLDEHLPETVCPDIWVVKLDAAGKLAWQRCLGGSSYDAAACIQQTANGGYVLAGHTRSSDGDVVGKVDIDERSPTDIWSSQDIWFLELNANGVLVRQHVLGGTADERASAIQQTADGGYIISGWTNSLDGDVYGLHPAPYPGHETDAWVVKLNAGGGLVWQRCLGGTGEDGASAVKQTSDGGYLAVGRAASTDGEVVGNHGDFDAWVVKMTNSNLPILKVCLGGTGNDGLSSVQPLADGGCLVAGYTHSTGLPGYRGGGDVWVARLDGNGVPVWTGCLGGSGGDYADVIVPDSAGDYLVAGETGSSDGDVQGYHGGERDAWAIKLDPAWNGLVRYEAEDFDRFHYYDTTRGNSGGVYNLLEDVDILALPGGGYAVTDTREGEWTQYSVSNQKSARYRYLTNCTYPLALRVNATGPGRSIDVKVNGVKVRTLNVPSSRGYVWANTTVELPPGQSTLAFVHHETKVFNPPELDFDCFGLDLGGAVVGFAFTPGVIPRVPIDLDGNGMYEDVNGNGRADFADVILYFNQMGWIPENQPVPAFDYNTNGRIDFADVVWLFNHL